MNIFEPIKLFDDKRIKNNDQSLKQLDIGDGIFENQIEEEHEVINIPNDPNDPRRKKVCRKLCRKSCRKLCRNSCRIFCRIGCR